MRAIMIDPEKRTVAEFNFEGDYKKIQTTLGCRRFTSGSRPLRGSIAEGFDGLYVSDDDMEDRDNPRFWFQVDADRDPPSSFPLAGPGLVLGVDKGGENCDAHIGVAELAGRITFTQRAFRGFRTLSGEAAAKLGAHIAVLADAPIIDGTAEDDSAR